MSPLTGAAVIPAAPLFVHDVSPTVPGAIADEVARLRAAISSALEKLATSDSALLLAAGRPRVSRQARATFAPLGVPGAEWGRPADAALSSAVAAAAGCDVDDGPLGLGHSALAAHLVSAAPQVALSALTVDPDSSAEDMLVLAERLGTVITAAGRVAVVAAGDLSAGLRADSPRALVAGAVAWDEAATRAVQDGDLWALSSLGPRDAARVHATGWAALLVTVALAQRAGARLDGVEYGAPRGVGALVATSVAP